MGTANQIEQELMNYISDHKIRNTHSHHLPEQAMVDFDLDKLINNTYLQWQQVTPGTTAESRNAYLEKTRYKSYFVWLQKAIGELYGISEPITAQNWDQISDQIRKAHQNPDFYMDVLKNTLVQLGYERVGQVEMPGQFSVRGGIVDIYSLTEENP